MPCGVDERVEAHACIACEAGLYNRAGDDASGEDTACDDDVCAVLLGVVSCDDAEEAYVKASNTGAGDSFGRVAMSADGSTLVVGAPEEDSGARGVDRDGTDDSAEGSGAVYVLRRSSGNVWSQEAYLKPSNSDTWESWWDGRGYFGASVSLSADGATLAIGAPFANAAYVFRQRPGVQWAEEVVLEPPFSRDGENVSEEPPYAGWSVALSGDGSLLAVGAPWEMSNGIGVTFFQPCTVCSRGRGAVYLFKGSETGGWNELAFLKPALDAQGLVLFGSSVSLSDTGIVAVGAPGENRLTGAVYVFKADELGVVSEYVRLTASNAQEGDEFGVAVSLSSDGATLAVGASGEDSRGSGFDGEPADDSMSGSGAVYVFEWTDGSRWAHRAYLKASDVGAEDRFGGRLSLSAQGNRLAVGAQGEDSGARGIEGDDADESAEDSGAVYLFERLEDWSWSPLAYVKAFNTDADDAFGIPSLSRDGRTLAVGAGGEDGAATGAGGDQGDNSAANSGAVYVYRLGP